MIFVGQIKAGKGIFDLVWAISILKKEKAIPEIPLLLFIGTPSNDNEFAALKYDVTSRNVGDDILFIPQQKNIHEWMQAADSLILPSHEGIEGMSRVIIEGMACGIAVIGTDISGIRETITQESGILVKEKSPEHISMAIKELLSNQAFLESLQKNGRRRAVNVFGISNHTHSVESFYEEVLGQ